MSPLKGFLKWNILEGANRTFIPLTQLTLIIDEGHVLNPTKGVHIVDTLFEKLT